MTQTTRRTTGDFHRELHMCLVKNLEKLEEDLGGAKKTVGQLPTR